MRRASHLWLAAIAGMLVAIVIAALLLPRSFGLVAFSDVIQSLLLMSGVAAFVPLALRSRGRVRLFWLLTTLGTALWLGYQLYWTFTEVLLRRDVPDLCVWDAMLFLHIAPMMAALALRPHISRDEYAARIGQLDFALLLLWWLYLYVLIVMPWQYVVANVDAYNRNLNSVYLAEKATFLISIAACWATSRGRWRRLYGSLFAVNLCYSASSAVANWAIARNAYYSGSLYDIPLVIAMAGLTWIGLRTKTEEAEADTTVGSTAYGVWVARFSMIAVFSLPLFAAWAISDEMVPAPIRVFRLALTFIAAFLMGILVFLRQRMLDRELVRLLEHSRESFESLQRLQAQILQSEKLASVTQLVGGAAHELNNPITAMLGYSDLLLNTQLSAEQQPVAVKIGQYVRRAKSLVASLISFARQAPSAKSPLDLNTLARTAVRLTQPQCEALQIEVRTAFAATLPKVMGDSNQLLQVCLQLIANCLHALNERGGHVMTLESEQNAGNCVLRIAISAAQKPQDGDPSPMSPEISLGLSACQGILQEHRGMLVSEQGLDGSVVLRVELPVAANGVAVKSKEPTSTVLWQSQPYA
ncbi:MAG TPA: histidine kinase dimerization/phospho-acceptor domain-containing protein [Candidatus Sulfotelmatobacter sp.]